VIQQHRYIRALMNVLAHASTLRPNGRGINPVAIQTIVSSARSDFPQQSS
jgi:hemerythrin-like domain-containing protein